MIERKGVKERNRSGEVARERGKERERLQRERKKEEERKRKSESFFAGRVS